MHIKDNFPDPWDKRKSPYEIHPHEPIKDYQKWISKEPKPATIADIFPRLERLSIGWAPQLEQLREITKDKPSYPPYDIVAVDDDVNLLNVAVAGFKKDEITVTVQDSVLTIEGRQKAKQNGDVVYQGIATRDFKLRLAIAEFWEVVNARLENGMLTVQFNRELPDEKKPKVIDINEI
jgi:molecular chaperone IbpA